MSDIKEILKRVKKDGELSHHDFPYGPVCVTMKDGSLFVWFNAFYILDMTVGHEASITVFTEHYGYHQFDLDEVMNSTGPQKMKEAKGSQLLDSDVKADK